MFITFDVSPDDDGPGILFGFTDPRSFDSLPPAERRERALAGFADLFGEEALQPIDYIDHCWGTEDFAPGGPTAAVPPGSWTTYGQWLRKPVDRSSGQAPKPPTNGPASSTGPSDRGDARPPKCTANYRAR